MRFGACLELEWLAGGWNWFGTCLELLWNFSENTEEFTLPAITRYKIRGVATKPGVRLAESQRLNAISWPLVDLAP